MPFGLKSVLDVGESLRLLEEAGLSQLQDVVPESFLGLSFAAFRSLGCPSATLLRCLIDSSEYSFDFPL